MQSPATSGYPGTPAMLIFAVFASFLLAKALSSALRGRRDSAGNSDWRKYAVVGIIAAYLLGTAIWAMLAHFYHSV